jgi:hypothetical protein
MHRADLRLGDVDAHPAVVEVHDRHHRRAGADGLARFAVLHGHDAGERRADHAVGEPRVELRDLGLRLGHRGALRVDALRPRPRLHQLQLLLGLRLLVLEHVELEPRLVELLLRHRAGVEEAARAVEIALRVGEAVGRGAQGGLRGDAVFAARARRHFGEERAGRLERGVALRAAREQLGAVEDGERVAGVDLVALAHADGLDAARCLEAQLGFGGFDGAGGGEVAGLRLEDGDFQRIGDAGQQDDGDDDAARVHRGCSRLRASHSGVSSPVMRASSMRAAISACRASISAERAWSACERASR